MIRFECDYSEGAHIKIIEKLVSTNNEQTPGYGTDSYSENAKNILKKLCENDNVDVHLLVGGTQTNTTVIASILRPYQGVISAETGHINTHETGAIEATGHKVITVKSTDGKISADKVSRVYNDHYSDYGHEHMVQPAMVYISNPTENGTIYTKKELEELSFVCRKYNMPLFLDGARLGYGIVSEKNDLSIADIAKLCDVFYIGGTKIGALFGEAVVISNDALKKDFRYHIKQKGGLLAKGRLLGIQFETLFEDSLYFDIAHNAVDLAMKIKDACIEKGYSFLYDTYTNQLFPIMPNKKIKELSKKYAFHLWEKIDEENSAIRICTSWATTEENVDKFIADIKLK